MRRIYIIAVSIMMATAFSLSARTFPGGDSFLRKLQERDSVLIGDQLLYGVRLESVPDGTGLALPDLSGGIMQGVEVLSPWMIDTVKTSGGKSARTMDLDIATTITSFDEGDYDLPPIRVVRRTPDGNLDTLVFSGQKFEVRTIPVDTTTYVPHDIKGQIRYPVTFKEILPYLLGFLGVAALVALAIVLFVRLATRQKKEGKPDDPPHIVALRRLDKLRGNKYWAPDRQKFFYSGITDALREYIAARYGFGAMEMTTAEVFDSLKDKDLPKDLYEETEELFKKSDFVKFAKMTFPDEENAKAVPLAIRFVTETYQEQVDTEAEKDVL